MYEPATINQISGESKQKFLIQDYLSIGTAEDNHVRLDQNGIEPKHARIDRTERGFIIRDLRTSSGTLVNGTKIIEAYLNSHDIIQIGPTTLSFRIAAADNLLPVELQASKNEEWNKQLLKLNLYGPSEHPILILGESGTGKEIIARALHDLSPRKTGPLISINCSAISESLIESELFGHTKGSFTGALGDRKGAFELARGGILFLDEIGDLPLSLQPKLLRALENGEIWPIGSDTCIKTDVRVIAATHPNLIHKVRSGTFRHDVFYRLNTITLNVPKLTDRLEDFDDLLFKFSKEMRVRFSFHAIQRLKLFEWPGNIRQLKNVIARASVEYPGQQVEAGHIDELLRNQRNSVNGPNLNSYGVNPSFNGPRSFSVLKEIEKEVIIQRLMANKGNQRKTAVELGIPKSTLHDRIRLYGIDTAQFRS